MAIKLVTLNVEGDRHLHRFLPVLKELNPDVVCFQEMFEVDTPMVAQELEMTAVKYVPTMKVTTPNKIGFALKGNWGVCLMSKLPVSQWEVHQYGPFEDIKEFVKPNDSRRAVIVGVFDHNQQRYRVATTHFTWSPGGSTTDEQRQDFDRLRARLSQYKDLILCGDFNAPRGGEMFSKFEELYIDHVPKDVTTTIENTLHYAGEKNLQLVVDSIFSTPDYSVTDVQMLSGISDHLGIAALVDRIK